MLSIDVVAEMLKYVPMVQPESNEEQQSSGEQNGEQEKESDETQNEGGQSGKDSNDEQGGMGADSEGIEGEQSDSETDSDSQPSDTTSKSRKSQQLSKKFQKQKDFINNNIKKKKLQKGEIEKLETLSESGTELVRVGNDYVDDYLKKFFKGVD
jgi:cobalamin biosynthesis protein CobT